MHIRLIILVLCVLAGCMPAFAQLKECGTVISPEQREAELRSRALLKPGEVRTPPILPYRIPLTVHICRMNDGTGGFTLAQLDTAMRQINQLYASTGIQFFVYGNIIYIDNTYFFTVKDVQTDRDFLRSQSVVANTVNVYFTNLDSLCGQGTFPGDKVQGVLINNDCAGTMTNTSSFAHELGHFLNLYHTHETSYGMECPDGSNCTTTGDLLCDTPADPDLTNRVTGCTYNGGVSAPAGCSGNYTPQVNNLMSYAPKNCRDVFTPGQVDRMLATLAGSRRYLLNLERYVAQGWTGSQSGFPEFPFTTISAALASAGPGMVIFASAAVYPENITVLQNVQLRLWSKTGVLVIGK
jgi:hypothetical protein